MPGQDLKDAIEAARLRPGSVQLEEVFRIALQYSADDRACRDVLDRITQTHRAEVAKAWADHHIALNSGRASGSRWQGGPTQDGWYVVHRRPAQFLDLGLVRVENGQCSSEIGAPMGTPTTVEFEGAKWLGPVERP